MRKIIFLIVIIICQQCFSYVNAQSTDEEIKPVKTRILFVFDASQSMYGHWQSDVKINIARRLLSDLLDSLKLERNLEVALRVYGHTKPYPPQDCDDTKLEVPFTENSFEKIKTRLKTLKPSGTTPIAMSLSQATNDFPSCNHCRNIIVLITDGIEECGGDPCEISYNLQKNGIVLKPFVIGIGRDFKSAFECVGTYFNAVDETSFKKALNVVVTQALHTTTAQVNLLDLYGNATETNIALSFYDNLSGRIKYNYIHTMNNKGVPDTLKLDPLLEYSLKVHTLPPVFLDSVKLISGKHKIIAIETPQGKLYLNMTGGAKSTNKYKAIIRKKGELETLHVQSFREIERYLVGKYDVEVLSIPRMKISNVDISQNKTTTVEIPASGIVVMKKSVQGYGSVYVKRKNNLELVYNLKDEMTTESVELLPGEYKVVFRSRYTANTTNTVEKDFVIESRRTNIINLYAR